MNNPKHTNTSWSASSIGAHLLNKLGLEDFRIVDGVYKGAPFAIMVILLFMVSDRALTMPDRPEVYHNCVTVRIVMAAICAAFIFFNGCFYHGKAQKELRTKVGFVRTRSALALFVVQVIADGTSLIGYFIAGSHSNYFGGLVMVFVAVAVLIPLRPGVLVANLAAMVAFYAGTLFYSEGRFILSMPALSNLSMVVGGAAVSWFAAQLWSKRTRSSDSADSSGKGNRVIVMILKAIWPVAGAVAALMATQDKSVPDRYLSLSGTHVIGRHSEDESIEFRNTSRFPITLEEAQVVIQPNSGPPYIFEIAFTSLDGKANTTYQVKPNDTVRVYTKSFWKGGYSIERGDKLNAALEDLENSTFHLFGFRLVP